MTAEDIPAALRALLRSDAAPSLPPVGREALLAATTELHDEAVAAMAERGVPADVARASLDDIPRKARLYGDLVEQDWLLQVFSGRVLTLGRLQFERDAGEHGRHLHIPELGPLDPARVDASLEWAERMFADDAPVICHSWIFDPALQRLPARSNLRAFVERFDIAPAPRTEQGAHSLAKFVFRSTPDEIVSGGLREDASSVERIAYAALAGDGRWSEATGVLRAS